MSEINLAAYRTFVAPWVRAFVNAPAAEWMQRLHPLRTQYELVSDESPAAGLLRGAAEQAREQRRPAAADNPLLALQEHMSKQIVAGLDAWRDARDAMNESMFLSIYGSPLLQAAVGIDPADAHPARRAGKSALHGAFIKARIDELRARFTAGGLREGLVRAMLHVGMAAGVVDERGFEAIRRIRLAQKGMQPTTLATFKAMVREQFFMLLIDQEAALAAIPGLLPADAQERRRAFALLPEVLSARGPIEGEAAVRLRRVAHMFGVDWEPGEAVKAHGKKITVAKSA